MGLPQQVVERENRANALIAEATQAAPPANTPESESSPKPPDQPAVETAAPASQTVIEPTPTQVPREDWKARYLVLKGKYDAEVPRLHGELAGVREELRVANEKLASAQAATASKTPQSAISDDDRARFDPELLNAVERVAQTAAAKAVEPMQVVVAEGRAEREARERIEREDRAKTEMIQTLNDLVPEWEQVDRESGWHQYLAAIDDSGKQRQAQLQEALAAHDATRLARLFLGYTRSRPSAPAQRPAPQVPTLAEQQVPDQRGTSRLPEKPILSAADYRKFQVDVTRGLYRNNPQRAQEIERQYDEALREGRVR